MEIEVKIKYNDKKINLSIIEKEEINYLVSKFLSMDFTERKKLLDNRLIKDKINLFY